MTAMLKSLSEKDRQGYQITWLFAFVMAVISAPFVIYFKTTAPWVIAIPLAVGGAVFLFVELHSCGFFQRDSHLVTLAEHERLLESYERVLTLAVQQRAKIPRGQLAFPNFPEATPRGAIRMLVDEDSKPIPSISCDKYSALLVAYLLDNLDTATEKSLRAGIERFAKMQGGSVALERFFTDKAVREAIKSDFRGNLVSLIAKGGDRVVKDLLKEVEALQQKRAASQETLETGSSNLTLK